jgi:hypothetical protein
MQRRFIVLGHHGHYTVQKERKKVGNMFKMTRNFIMIENKIDYCNLSNIGIGVIAFDIVDDNG